MKFYLTYISFISDLNNKIKNLLKMELLFENNKNISLSLDKIKTNHVHQAKFQHYIISIEKISSYVVFKMCVFDPKENSFKTEVTIYFYDVNFEFKIKKNKLYFKEKSKQNFHHKKIFDFKKYDIEKSNCIINNNNIKWIKNFTETFCFTYCDLSQRKHFFNIITDKTNFKVSFRKRGFYLLSN